MENALFRLDVIVSEEQVDVALGVMVQYAGGFGWEEESRATGETVFRVHTHSPEFCEALKAALAAALPEAAVEQSRVRNQDWASAWRAFFTPVPIRERFVIIGPWMLEELPPGPAEPLLIEPKCAFGTGHHATTSLCLHILADLAATGRIRKGMRFLDLGTGSGILSVACAKLGLTGVAVDIDPLAVDNATENRTVNHAGGLFDVRLGSVEAAGGEQYDLIVANILAEPLRLLAPEILPLLRPGGCLILSGLLDIQASAVSAAYTAFGLPEPARRTDGEWAALIWERHGAR